MKNTSPTQRIFLVSDPVARGTLCPHCSRYNSRHVVVNGVVIFENKILLVKRGIEPAKGQWALPGGYLDWDETAEEGVLREVREEAGVKGEIVEFLGVYSSAQRESQNVSLIFQVKALAHELILQESEILGGKWFSFDDIPGALAFDHTKIVTDFINQSK